MKIKKTIYKDYDFFEIDNGIIQVTLCSLGASIYKIVFDNKIMTLTPKNIDDFLKNFYYGKTIGRLANRIENGKVTVDNKIYQMDDLNEGPNTLHSGKNGFSNKTFQSDIVEFDNEVSVSFSYFSKDGEQGLPGNVSLKVTYVVKENDNSLYLSFDCSSDKETPLNIVNHLYFSLGDSSIDKMDLAINATKYIECRANDLIPVMEKDILPCLDFRNKKSIIKDINHSYLQNHKSLGYDHCFILDNYQKNMPSLVLSNDKYKMEIFTNYPAIQIYTCNYVDGVDYLTSTAKEHCGIAIEPEESLLKPFYGKILHREVCYKFTKE